MAFAEIFSHLYARHTVAGARQAVPALRENESAVHELPRTLPRALEGNFRPTLRQGTAPSRGLIGAPSFRRQEVIAGLDPSAARQGDDLTGGGEPKV